MALFRSLTSTLTGLSVLANLIVPSVAPSPGYGTGPVSSALAVQYGGGYYGANSGPFVGQNGANYGAQPVSVQYAPNSGLYAGQFGLNTGQYGLNSGQYGLNSGQYGQSSAVGNSGQVAGYGSQYVGGGSYGPYTTYGSKDGTAVIKSPAVADWKEAEKNSQLIKQNIDNYLTKQHNLGKRKLTVSVNYGHMPSEYQYLNQYHDLPFPGSNTPIADLINMPSPGPSSSTYGTTGYSAAGTVGAPYSDYSTGSVGTPTSGYSAGTVGASPAYTVGAPSNQTVSTGSQGYTYNPNPVQTIGSSSYTANNRPVWSGFSSYGQGYGGDAPAVGYNSYYGYNNNNNLGPVSSGLYEPVAAGNGGAGPYGFGLAGTAYNSFGIGASSGYGPQGASVGIGSLGYGPGIQYGYGTRPVSTSAGGYNTNLASGYGYNNKPIGSAFNYGLGGYQYQQQQPSTVGIGGYQYPQQPGPVGNPGQQAAQIYNNNNALNANINGGPNKQYVPPQASGQGQANSQPQGESTLPQEPTSTYIKPIAESGNRPAQAQGQPQVLPNDFWQLSSSINKPPVKYGEQPRT